MSVFGPRAQSRSATLLMVAAVHGLLLWAIGGVRAPADKEVETFASVMFFVPQAVSHRPAAATTPPARSAERARRSIPAPAPQPAIPARATTQPAAPTAGIDWSAQLTQAAGAELEKEEKARQQLGALTRKYVVA